VTAFDLTGRRVVVTGAGRGLGAAMAIAAANAGADVIGVARSIDQLETVGRMVADGPGGFTARRADLADVAMVEDVLDAVWDDGPVHGVVHAAGVQLRKPAVEFTREEWRRVQLVNLETPYFISTNIAARQQALGLAASHVFVGSLASSIGLPNVAPYAASKSGLLGAMRTLALEWAGSNVRVNAVAPGYFRTELTAELLADPAQEQRVLRRVPIGRLGDPAELGGPVVFLLSDAASYVTGHLLNVDGGWLSA
jgi:2-deoxy-D-gluconate 3-dehydrogenase